MEQINKVLDIKGVEIKAGQKVLVHQEEETRLAFVVQPFPDSPTDLSAGYWVDINIDNLGVEGMPSYLLEIVE